MSFLSIFTKFKTLSPVIVVGTAVLVTVKLLTTQTPTNQEELKVNAEEDISLVDFKDEIVIPEPEPKPEEEVPQVQKQEEESSEEDEDEKEEKESFDAAEDENSQKQAEQETESQKKEEKNTSKRRFIKGGVADIFARLLKPKEKG